MNHLEDDNENPDGKSLNEILGIPPFDDLPNPPPVDYAALGAFANQVEASLSEEAQQRVIQNLVRYKAWREALGAVIKTNSRERN